MEKQLLEQGAELFGKKEKPSGALAEAERKEGLLFEKIGQLTVERDFLKKAWGKFHGNNDDN